jgi:hypothetical protein
MSYQEKSVTISLVTYLLILAYYCARVVTMFQGGGLVSSQLFGLWAIVIIATIPTSKMNATG